jgi:hypothetical protein
MYRHAIMFGPAATLFLTSFGCGRINVAELPDRSDAGLILDANRTPPSLLVGCELYFAMEEDSWALGLVDSCSDNKGVVVGSQQIVDDLVRGRVGEFDGTGCIEVPDREPLQGGSVLTISAWIHPRLIVGGGAYGVISKRLDYGVSTEYALWVETIGGDSNFLSLDIDGNNDRFRLPADKFADSWRQVALVYDGSRPSTQRVAIYTEGLFRTFANETSSTITPFPSRAALSIGCLPLNGVAQSFGGRMDDVVIWSRALSAAEVSAWYTATKK